MNKNVYKYDDMKRREHMAVRTTAGWYLWTHQLMEVYGADAAAFLDTLFPVPVANLPVGKDRYTTMLNEDGIIIDDVVVMRLEEEKFWISTLFATKLLSHLAGHKEDYKVRFKNVTSRYHMYAVQGPRSAEIVNDIIEGSVDGLKYFTFIHTAIDGVPVIVNRAGFTGEKLGYEIYIAADQWQFLEEKIKEAGEKVSAQEVTEFQILAWTLPTEAGFYYMRDLMYTNPYEVGLTRGFDFDREFVGKQALLKIKEEGPKREMLGFTLEEADVRINGKDQGGPGSPVSLGGEEIGRVSKFNYSYVQEKPVGYILVEAGRVKPGDHVVINNLYDALVCEKRFL